jgi:poly(3-hydroxyalkanoate) depolymerase
MNTKLRRITVLGQEVRVAVRAGTRHGPPLVLCNGVGASLDLFQPFVDAVDPAIEVVSFDVPGVGGSPMPKVPYSFGMLAWFLGKVLDRLGYSEVDVLGISWGGGLAQQFAFQNPRRCRRLVLVSTATGCLMVPAHPRVLRKMITPRRYRDAGYAASIAAELYGGRMREQPELVRQLLHDNERLGSPLGYLFQLLAGAGWTSLPFLALVRQRTLILAGEDDPIIPPVNARILHRLLPNSSLHSYPDGHLGLVTMAPELGAIVGSFLTAGVPPGERDVVAPTAPEA